jgi:hypothetical protein
MPAPYFLAKIGRGKNRGKNSPAPEVGGSG